MKKLKGNITISRTQSNMRSDYISIVIEDELSGCRIIEAQMELDAFAKCVTGLGAEECLINHASTEYLGKQREVKSEQVRVTKFCDLTEEEITDALLPYEVDGWVGRRSNFKNSHCYNRDNDGWLVSVVFTRFVDAPEVQSAIAALEVRE